MNFTSLQKILENQPSFRYKQCLHLIFIDLISSWKEATTLPKELIRQLEKEFPLIIQAEDHESMDRKTIKLLITLPDNLQIETVLMKHDDNRNTICISSQVGCSVGCKFCSTGKMGFKRNLTDWEMVMQVLRFARKLKEKNEKVNNVVIMGMGEPFLNYDNVLSAVKILNNKDMLNLGARHISISTVGIIEGIKKLSDEKLQVNLAISLHAPNDELRSKLIPVNTNYPISKIMQAVQEYVAKTHRKVMFEYVMLKNINDSEQHAHELAKLLKHPLYMVNLIPYNPTGDFQASDRNTINQFQSILSNKGIETTIRYSFGTDIKGACGQLATADKE